MLTYSQVHFYFTIPPALALYFIYRPLLGRRDILKIGWLCFMATAYTTIWDNWIISQSGWSYPPGSVLGRIALVPLEEHFFFVIQPTILVLLYCLVSHSRLLPFPIPSTLHVIDYDAAVSSPCSKTEKANKPRIMSQTLSRRPFASGFWILTCILGAILVNDAHELSQPVLGYGRQGFYLGWILVWISPVIGWLTWLGGSMRTEGWKAWAIGSAYFCMVDTIAIRSGAWSISCETSLCFEPVHGLPIEELIFFLLTSYLVVIATSLIAHLHTLLLLCPDLPACPPRNPVRHIAVLARVALDPPLIDRELLKSLRFAEETLRKGSKSFEVAKLAFGREMRIGLIAIYAWCRVTDDLIDDSADVPKEVILAAISRHLDLAFTDPENCDAALDTIPSLSRSGRSAFHLFASIIPRLVPSFPFEELVRGYRTDMAFTTNPADLLDPKYDFDRHLPIKTQADLLKYADFVAGSIAAAICYLSWSILDSEGTRPVEHYPWARDFHSGAGTEHMRSDRRIITLSRAREMGRALQLVNIARDIAKDALIGRIYVPLSAFPSAAALANLITGTATYAQYSLPLLDLADNMRRASRHATRDLPWTAQAGARAMSASYFEIATAVRRNGGEVNQRGIKVSKWRRAWAAASAYWGGS